MNTNARATDAVLLLHGLWMKGFVMCYLAHALTRQEFAAHAFSYRSTRETLDDHLDRLSKRIAALGTKLGATRVHLVGHSFGGLVVLRYLQRSPDKRIGRAVLLGAPVAGCRAAAAFAQRRGGEFLLGKSLDAWREPVNTSLDPRCEVGVIAGTRGLGFARAFTRLPDPNDGVVCLDETRFRDMRDHLALPIGHMGMLLSARVARQTGEFLRTGAFSR
jgi:pimeloyl-ACP methyl ester carboxylesterase